ncbi:hypothetical protein BDQ17DRAFT_1257145, partial [Cyathus striatus]
DLHGLELSAQEWNSIDTVSTWLLAFRQATTQMSATKHPMLSTTHTIFRGLQEELKNAISLLPNSTNPRIRTGLVNAHKKLSDYYHRFNKSPYYIWAACKFGSFASVWHNI